MKGEDIGVVSLIITLNDLFVRFVFSVPTTLSSVCFEVLVPQSGKASSRRQESPIKLAGAAIIQSLLASCIK